MDFVYGHVFWILCMLCVDMSLHVLFFLVMHACFSLSTYLVYLYFVLSSITKKGEIEAHLGR